jgi:hypothetical protein
MGIPSLYKVERLVNMPFLWHFFLVQQRTTIMNILFESNMRCAVALDVICIHDQSYVRAHDVGRPFSQRGLLTARLIH